MSIAVAQNTNAQLVLSGVISTYNRPITVCAKVKVVGWPASGTYSVLAAGVGTAGGVTAVTGYAGARFQRTSSTAWLFKAASSDGSVNGDADLNMFSDADITGGWKTIVANLASATSRTAYGYINDVLSSANLTTSRNPSVVDSVLLTDGSWGGTGGYKVALIKIYGQTLTVQQIAEYDATGSIAGLTPLFTLDATSDWGVSDVTATGAWGSTFTAPGGWTYSSDNPTLTPLATVTFDSNLEPGAAISGTCTGFANGAGVISGGGISFPVTIVDNTWSGTVTDFADNLTYPLLPATGVNWTLTQNTTTASVTKDLIVKSGFNVVTFTSFSEVDWSLAKAFTAAGNPLVLNDAVFLPSANGLVSGTDSLLAMDTNASGTLYIRRVSDGKIYAHNYNLQRAGSIDVPTPAPGSEVRGRTRRPTALAPTALPPTAYPLEAFEV